MDINKIIAYVLSGLGLVGIIVSSGKLKESIPIIKSLPTTAIIIASVIIIAIGIFLLKSKSSVKQPKEVPIYEGKGKKRHIVGYQREK